MLQDEWGCTSQHRLVSFYLPVLTHILVCIATVVLGQMMTISQEFVILEIESGGYWGTGKLIWLVKRDTVKTHCNCIQLKRQGRWGNNIYQVMQALHLAQLTRISTIFVPRGFIFLTNTLITTNGIEIRPEDPPLGYDCIFAKLYYYVEGTPLLNVSVIDVFRDEYLKMFPDPHLPKGSLVMHMRSGDVFGWGIRFYFHRGYAQPPCKYYEDVMKMRNWSHVVVLAQDLGNPCTKYVLDRGAVFNRRSLRSDLGYLLNAENVVCSNGTFARVAGMISKKLVRFYAYDSPDAWLPSHFNCLATNEYKEKVIGKWAMSDEQMDLMMHSAGCSAWEYVNRTKPEHWLFKNQLGQGVIMF